ncbi:MAG: hypothetical protein EBS36_03875 [Actinobacteria bacterium]|nr:hypothetical protein [Actinomycetota bacterium]
MPRFGVFMIKQPVFKKFALWLSIVALTVSGLALPAQAARLTKPGKVVKTKVVAADKALTVSWSKGSGGTPTSYLLTLMPGNKKSTSKKTSATFSKLINGKKYSVSIVAKNAAGQSTKVTVYGTPKKGKSSPTPTPSASDSMRVLNFTGSISGGLSEQDSSDDCSEYSVQESLDAEVTDPSCTLRVAAILSNGQMFTSTASAGSKNFAIQVRSSKSAQSNLTLHLVRANGAYVGPVLVKTGGYTGISVSTAGTTVSFSLGAINLNSVDIDPSSTVDNRTAFGKLASDSSMAGTLKVRLNGSAPAGAGKAGFVSDPTITKFKLRALLTGKGRVTQGSTGTNPNPSSSPGGDTDPCPNLGKGGSGTLTTSCYQAILFLLSQDVKFEQIKNDFQVNCQSIAGNSKATYEWILSSAPKCADVMGQIMSASNGGGNGSGDNGSGGSGGDQGPCPGFDQLGSGTLNTDCVNNFVGMLSKDPAFAPIKSSFEGKCSKYATDSRATFGWIKDNDADCFNVLMQVFAAFGGNSGGSGGDNGGGSGGGEDPCAKVSPGSDPDSDGIPNALDVDDDGDLVIDSADPSANNGCSIEPMKGIRTSIERPLNYGLINMSAGSYTESDFSSDINDYLSGPEFGIGYYVYSNRFFPEAYITDTGEMPAVWVGCAGVLWCDPKTARATLGTFVEQTNADGASGCNPSGFFDYSCNAPFNQPDYFGGANGFADSKCGYVSDPADRSHNQPCWSEIKAPMTFGNSANSNCQVNKFNADFSLPAGLTFPADATNFFWRQTCQMDGKPGMPMSRSVMGAGINPEVARIEGAPPAQDVLSPLNVLTLNYFNKDGNVSSVATTLGAYPITGPLVKSVDYNGSEELINYSQISGGGAKALGSGGNGAQDNAPNAIVIQPGKKLTVTFYRPQRQAFPGEDASSGYHDVHGLSYGLEFEIKNVQLGCGASSGNPDFGGASFDSAYDPTSADFTTNGSLDTGANALAPLRDAVVDSPTEKPASSTLTFTLDIAKCFQDRAAFLMQMYNKTGYSFASGQDVLKAMELPEGAPIDGSATDWATTTGLPTNGDTTCINMNLNGRSEAKTGGTDSSLQRLCVQFAPGSLVPVAPPKNNQQNFLHRTLGYFRQHVLGAIFR